MGDPSTDRRRTFPSRLALCCLVSMAACGAGTQRPIAGSSAHTVALPPFTFARRVIGHAVPPVATGLVLGFGWGCAAFGSEAATSWQCWEAGQAPKAWRVPWLNGKALQSGPDRVCELAPYDLAFRCWYRPAREQASGREVPASWEWLNPNHTAWDDWNTRSDRPEAAFVGGTFACLQATKDGRVWCLGDDAFGQLGGSSPAPPPDADRADHAFVRDLGLPRALALGTWHACAIEDGYIACWGRGDAGQLGVRAREACAAGGAPVACARSARVGPSVGDPLAELAAGDLFTCLGTNGVTCWGASRDAFFGAPGSCPEALRAAWPTPQGPLSAPRAACSDSPVAIPDAKDFKDGLRAGPRGICFNDARGLRCVGGVPTPRQGRVRDVAISPGPDASACAALWGEGVVCWGEGYSPAGAPETPVRVAFEPAPAEAETAVFGASDRTRLWSGCIARRGCEPLSPLPLCDADLHVTEWRDLLASARELSGTIVNVRGPLGVGMGSQTAMACRTTSGDFACCNGASSPVVLGDANGFALAGFGCLGDESAECCDAPAYGQTVVATGRLDLRGATLPFFPSHTLYGVSLCRPRP
jgi:hypothetical protein